MSRNDEMGDTFIEGEINGQKLKPLLDKIRLSSEFLDATNRGQNKLRG